MFTVFRYFVGRSRGAIFGWGISVALLGMFMVSFFDTLAEQKETLELLINQYPPEMMAFFGGTAEFFTPAGFLNIEFFSYMPLVIGIFAVLLGSGMLLGDEENGTLDLVLSMPISRSGFFFGRLLAVIAILAAILGMIWIGFVIGEQSTTMNLTPVEMLRPFLALFSILFLFSSLSVFLSMVLPSRNMTATLSGLILFASYFINSMAQLNKDLEQVADFLPMRYYQSGYAIDGLNIDWLLGLIGFSILFNLAAWIIFLRRDIRVSGEGSWRLPFKRTRSKYPSSKTAEIPQG